MPLSRALKNKAKNSLRKIFEVGQRLGVDILPRHFYSSIPDIRELRRTTHWRQPMSMVGLNGTDLDQQVQFARRICAPHAARLAGPTIHKVAMEDASEVGFGQIEAEFLYCLAATNRPSRIIQVGCGVSTAVILRAFQDVRHDGRITCIEPYPTPFLKEMDRQGRIQLIAGKAQDVDLATLTALGSGDLLFVDSSHVVLPGSEVVQMILEVMPRLGSGVWVHFHDIPFPYTYSRQILTKELFFNTEIILLQAYLADNPRYTIRLAQSMLHYARPDVLRELHPHYAPDLNEQHGLGPGAGHFPTSACLECLLPPA